MNKKYKNCLNAAFIFFSSSLKNKNKNKNKNRNQ